MTINQLQKKIKDLETRLQQMNSIQTGVITIERFGQMSAEVYIDEVKKLIAEYILNKKPEKKGKVI